MSATRRAEISSFYERIDSFRLISDGTCIDLFFRLRNEQFIYPFLIMDILNNGQHFKNGHLHVTHWVV